MIIGEVLGRPIPVDIQGGSCQGGTVMGDRAKDIERLKKLERRGVPTKDIERLRKLERRGVPINWAALERNFNFVVSGIVSIGVDNSVFFELAESLMKNVDKSKFKCELKTIVLFPIILKGDGMTRADFVRNKWASRSYHIGVNIDFSLWMKVRSKRRLQIATDTFKSAISLIPDRSLSVESKSKLTSVIAAAARTLGRS